ISTGPGVSWPSASPSTNSRGVNQPNWPTTWSWMNAIIVKPPPIVNAPTLRKYAPISTRLLGSGTRAVADVAAPEAFSHQGAERTTRTSADETALTRGPGFSGWSSNSPAQPARIRIATTPSDVTADAPAAATPMAISVTVLAADLPRRYTASPKRASTTGPSP